MDRLLATCIILVEGEELPRGPARTPFIDAVRDAFSAACTYLGCELKYTDDSTYLLSTYTVNATTGALDIAYLDKKKQGLIGCALNPSGVQRARAPHTPSCPLRAVL